MNRAYEGGRNLEGHGSIADCPYMDCAGCEALGNESAVRCQFCGRIPEKKAWHNDACPKCGKKYDAILAQEGDD